MYFSDWFELLSLYGQHRFSYFDACCFKQAMYVAYCLLYIVCCLLPFGQGEDEAPKKNGKPAARQRTKATPRPAQQTNTRTIKYHFALRCFSPPRTNTGPAADGSRAGNPPRAPGPTTRPDGTGARTPPQAQSQTQGPQATHTQATQRRCGPARTRPSTNPPQD